MRAKQFYIQEWFNETPETKFILEEESIKFIHFFQMLCPGCVYYGIPETLEVFHKFQSAEFKVFGVHSVFEHHEVMAPDALKVFMQEWKIPFPVGVDLHQNHWMPETMRTYALQGTPTTMIIDKKGEIRLKHFGQFDTQKLHSFLEGMIHEGDIT